jgi:beta-lactamase superfamily II metal-dependent hydrolase
MTDYYEIDFLDVETKKSGDAITIRYSLNGETRIHVTDGGFQDTGDAIIEHINKYYNAPSYIDAVVVTHPDGDHTGGLRKLFNEYEIRELWMLRPWLYADELIDRFSRFTSVDNLIKRLKDLYPNIAALEELAEEHSVSILEPFQGAHIGDFIVLAPTKNRYLDLIIESDKTPESTKSDQASFKRMVGQVVAFVQAAWGKEAFPEEDTSAENNMSVIQYVNLCEKRILLTGDAGRAALAEAAEYAPSVGLALPGVDRIQVPHHGSRHNVSTEILDQWLGQRLSSQPGEGDSKFTAIVSASKADENHPRKAVIRAFIHRGGKVFTTKGRSLYIHHNAPNREGWVPVEAVPYPEEEEEL